MAVIINDKKIADIKDLDLHPLLSRAGNDSGSMASGGPRGWIAAYRNHSLVEQEGRELCTNSLVPLDQQRTFADSAVGANDFFELPPAFTGLGARFDELRVCSHVPRGSQLKPVSCAEME